MKHVPPSKVCSLIVFVLVECSFLAFFPFSSTDRFEPVPNKLVGLWPDEWSLERLIEFRTRYGFTGIGVGVNAVHYHNALKAGFDSSAVMIGMSIENYTYAVDSFPASIYYIDEPVEHKCSGAPTASRIYSPQELEAIRDYVHSRRPHARFAISGYKRCSHNRSAAAYADIMFYPSYINWVEMWPPVCVADFGWGDARENPWMPWGDDQRDSWTDMRKVFGEKFSMTWVRGQSIVTGDEYPELIAHANELGLDGVWLFNLRKIDPALLEEFTAAAAGHGWLKRVAE